MYKNKIQWIQYKMAIPIIMLDKCSGPTVLGVEIMTAENTKIQEQFFLKNFPMSTGGQRWWSR